MTADPAADQRQGRPRDCTSPSFSSHHEAAWRRPRREARAPCGVIGRSAKGWQQKVIRAGLDTGRDREAVVPSTDVRGRNRPDAAIQLARTRRKITDASRLSGLRRI